MQQIENRERHYGIDMLRIISMFMVCVLHCNIFGQYSKMTWGNEPWEYLGWVGSEALCIIAVNLYAMITGYVCITAKWRISRYLSLWLQVAFYTVILYVLWLILSWADPMPGIGSINLMRMAQHMLTIPMAGAYWYFNAYTALFFLIPFLNQLLRGLTCTDYLKLLLVSLILLPCMNMLSGPAFYSTGYNMAWLAALYTAGAFFRLHPVKIHKGICLAIYLLAAIGTFAAYSLARHGLTYAMPFNIVGTIALFLLFTEMQIQQGWLKTVIRFMAPLTFGIYLVQCHPFMWNALHKLGNVVVAQYGHPAYAPWAGGLCLFLGCLCIDWLRYRLFRLCHAAILAERMAALLTALWHKILPFLMPPRA